MFLRGPLWLRPHSVLIERVCQWYRRASSLSPKPHSEPTIVETSRGCLSASHNKNMRRAKGSGNRIEFAAFKNLWRASAQHIADASSAHGCRHAQQERRQDCHSIIERPRASGHREQAKRGSVNKDDRPLRVLADSLREDIPITAPASAVIR